MSVSIIFFFHFLHPIKILNELHGAFSVCFSFFFLNYEMNESHQIVFFYWYVFRYSDVIVASIPNLIAKHVRCVITWLSISLFQWTRFFVLKTRKKNPKSNVIINVINGLCTILIGRTQNYFKLIAEFFFLLSFFFLSSKRKQQYAFLLQLKFVSLAINRCAHR